MRNKKLMIPMSSFALAAFLVVGGTALASPMGMMNMMNGNGENDMINENGMSNRMGAMEDMTEACQNFMSSYGETDDTQE